MAFTPLSINTTLVIFKANVRANTKTVSPQESMLLESHLTDLVHNAVIDTRNAQDIWALYQTEAKSADSDIAESSNLIDVSTLEIADPSRMSLYDATHGPFSFKTSVEFDQFKTLYGTAQLVDAMFCRLVNVKATDNKRQIETYRGSNKATPGYLTLTYVRSPKKATADATKIDLPDELMPQAIARCTQLVFEWLKGMKSA